MFSILDFGADPTGQRDSTPALRAAWKAAWAANGVHCSVLSSGRDHPPEGSDPGPPSADAAPAPAANARPPTRPGPSNLARDGSTSQPV